MKTLLLLGGSHFYRPLIAKAHELGLRVVLVDKNPNVVGRSEADVFEQADIIDTDAVLAVARNYLVDAILPVNDWGVATASTVAAQLGLRGTPTDVVDAASNKRLMRERWRDAGCANPAYEVTSTSDEAVNAARVIGYPIMLKASDNMGASRGVVRSLDEAELQRQYAYCKGFSRDGTVLVERCAEGSEHSIEALSINGEVHILAISDKVKLPYPYRVDKAVLYPTRLDAARQARIRKTVERAVKALGIVDGPSHTELSFTAEGPVLFETACRGGGGRIFSDIVFLVTGVDYAKETLKHLLGQPVSLRPTRHAAAALGFITPPPGRILDLDGVEEATRLPYVFACESLKAIGETVTEVKSGGNRAGYYIVTAETRDDVERCFEEMEQKTLIRTG